MSPVCQEGQDANRAVESDIDSPSQVAVHTLNEPAAHVPSKSVNLHIVRKHTMSLNRSCVWCQEHDAIHKRLRNDMSPVPIPRTQWLCAECT